MGVIGVAALAAAACSADDNEPAASEPTTAATTAPPTGATSSAGSEPGWSSGSAVGPDPEIDRPIDRPIGFASLQFFGDCPALLDHMQTIAAERVTPWGLDGGYYGAFPATEEAMDDAAIGDTDAQVDFESAGSAGADFSGTNVQEVGVDEGDVVETDGEHLYVASPNGGVQIVAVESADVVSALDVPEGEHQLLLDGNRLAVITSSWSGVADTVVSLYEVSDPAAATLISRHHLEGRVVATRAIDGIARIVVSTSFGQRLPFVTPGQFGYDDERALARNREIIAESDVSEWLPRRFVESTDGEFGAMEPALGCESVGAPDAFSGLGVTWIASVDLDGADAPQGAAGVVADGSTVYASPTSLYVANQQWDTIPLMLDEVAAEQAQPTEPAGPPPTFIHRFDLAADGGASYVASGSVPGRLLNQFAMSEHDGDLRVATTVEDWNTGNSESIVTVLRPTDGELREISAIGGLGRGEQIFAVRFMGEVGYVVTFRQIDPLYVIDLSDPMSPALEGELKIPGYSAYLHPVGDGLLLGVGQDATDEGRALGTQLSLFDVSEPTDPQRIDTLSIGGWSDVEWDHRAFLYWPADGTIAIPASPGWNECGPGQTCLADSLRGAGGTVVAQLDGTDLSARGVIDGDTSTNCWNPPLRTVAIDDELAAVSPNTVVFADRASLDVRDEARWGDAEQYGCYWYE
ncbi:MAG: beta-propeller domain-containing protein [Actinomycetota bacterium]